MKPSELRRAPRIVSDLWVMIAGVDNEPILRRGDVSQTGIFFNIERPFGAVGSVQHLLIESPDRKVSVAVMARIVRIVTVDDMSRESANAAVALTFLPESNERYLAIDALVRRLLELAIENEQVELRHGISAEVLTRREEPKRAVIYQLSVRQMYLETTWPVRIGETVQVVFRSAGTRSRIPFEGEVVDVRPQPAPTALRYAVQVQLDAPGVRRPRPGSGPAPGSITDSVDLIFADILDGASPSEGASFRKEHLVGLLSRIRLPSLLTLFDMERSSGELRLARGIAKVRVYVHEGRIIDAEAEGQTDPRKILTDALFWTEGTFDFSMCDVDRPDRLQTTTTALLLDLAREADESSRGPDGGETTGHKGLETLGELD